MVEPRLVGMDTTLMNDICRGFGHGKWSMDASAGAIRRPLPEYPATYGHLHLFTLHNLQGACTSLASCHSRHNPRLGFYGWENRGRVLCLRSHSQLTSQPLPPETTGGSPWLPSFQKQETKPLPNLPHHQACDHLLHSFLCDLHASLSPSPENTAAEYNCCQQPHMPKRTHPQNPFSPGTGSEFSYTHPRTVIWSCPLPGPGKGLLGTSPAREGPLGFTAQGNAAPSTET